MILFLVWFELVAAGLVVGRMGGGVMTRPVIRCELPHFLSAEVPRY